MIADTTFVSAVLRERRLGSRGPALSFLAQHRGEPIRVSIITVGEIAAWLDTSSAVWQVLHRWPLYRLHAGIVEAAADVDRLLTRQGRPLGENDNWIAGFARYYREPLISRDTDFDRVPGMRRVAY